VGLTFKCPRSFGGLANKNEASRTLGIWNLIPFAIWSMKREGILQSF